jgi:hypothetical protein
VRYSSPLVGRRLGDPPDMQILKNDFPSGHAADDRFD